MRTFLCANIALCSKAVRECVVHCHTLAHHEKVIVGYWTSKAGQSLLRTSEQSLQVQCAGVEDSELEEHLKAELPEYMLPQAGVKLSRT